MKKKVVKKRAYNEQTIWDVLFFLVTLYREKGENSRSPSEQNQH